MKTAYVGWAEVFDETSLVEGLTEALAQHFGSPPEVAVVLGSGWKERAADLLDDARDLNLHGLDNWPKPAVEGHGARLRSGSCGGRRVLLCEGRVHAYEAYEAREIVRGVRAMVHWGTPAVLLLNAAGGLSEERAPGSLMPFSDHLNLGLPNPLVRGQNSGAGPQFLDLADLYDEAWREALCARREELRAGVYAGVRGPSYETPAEVRALAAMGADAVGMSTIPEAIAAHALGARVMAISLITNLATGIGGSRPDHAEVLETAAEHGAQAAEVLAEAIACAPRRDGGGDGEDASGAQPRR